MIIVEMMVVSQMFIIISSSNLKRTEPLPRESAAKNEMQDECIVVLGLKPLNYPTLEGSRENEKDE